MSKPLADFVKDLMKRGGIDTTPELETLLASKPFSEAQLPDETAAKIGSSFITVKDAKEHPDVRIELKGMFAGTWENAVKRHLKEKYNWSEEEWRDFKGSDSKSSILDRIELVMDKVHVAGKKEGEKLGGGNPEELRKSITEEVKKEFSTKLEKNAVTISEYEKKLGEQETALKQTKEDSAKQVFALKRDTHLNSLIDSLPVRKDLTASPMLKEATRNAILKGLFEKAEIIEVDGTWEPRQKADPTAKYLKENKIISLEDLLKDFASEFLDPNAGKTPAPQITGIPPKREDGTNNPWKNSGPAKVNI